MPKRNITRESVLGMQAQALEEDMKGVLERQMWIHRECERTSDQREDVK